jgi:hypothetical protein
MHFYFFYWFENSSFTVVDLSQDHFFPSEEDLFLLAGVVPEASCGFEGEFSAEWIADETLLPVVLAGAFFDLD